jgi:hypothetical protein
MSVCKGTEMSDCGNEREVKRVTSATLQREVDER